MTTHSGAVTYRRTDTEPLFLIISSSDGSHWVLPKGHIESGESPEMAALRELREEAGVIGRIIEPLAIEEFNAKKEKVNAQYFLVEEVGHCQPEESRVIRWENARSAFDLLSHEESRRILLQGMHRIR